MYEINVSIGADKAEALRILKDKLAPYVAQADGVMVMDASGGRSTISLACEEEKKSVLTCGLTESVADLIINRFKSDYLIENSRLPMSNVVNYNAFLKALVAFDREFDRELVLRKLFLSQDLMLDGFYNFRLRELRNRWQEVVALANDNSGYLTFHETFLELLKFIVGTIDESIDEVHIDGAADKYALMNADGSAIPYLSFNLSPDITEENLLSELIVLSPKSIYVRGDCLIPDYVLSLMKSVFDKKLTVL
jgi:hypothetical protein